MLKHNVPYIKVGHQWRVEQESYELFMEKLQCHSSFTQEKTVSFGGSEVKYTSEINTSQFVKAQNVLRNEMQKKS